MKANAMDDWSRSSQLHRVGLCGDPFDARLKLSMKGVHYGEFRRKIGFLSKNLKKSEKTPHG